MSVFFNLTTSTWGRGHNYDERSEGGAGRQGKRPSRLVWLEINDRPQQPVCASHTLHLLCSPAGVRANQSVARVHNPRRGALVLLRVCRAAAHCAAGICILVNTQLTDVCVGECEPSLHCVRRGERNGFERGLNRWGMDECVRKRSTSLMSSAVNLAIGRPCRTVTPALPVLIILHTRHRPVGTLCSTTTGRRARNPRTFR